MPTPMREFDAHPCTCRRRRMTGNEINARRSTTSRLETTRRQVRSPVHVRRSRAYFAGDTLNRTRSRLFRDWRRPPRECLLQLQGRHRSLASCKVAIARSLGLARSLARSLGRSVRSLDKSSSERARASCSEQRVQQHSASPSYKQTGYKSNSRRQLAVFSVVLRSEGRGTSAAACQFALFARLSSKLPSHFRLALYWCAYYM